ncbi:MAG: glycosyltransferase family 87 protein [Candidatus Hermodarchaeota archaeon]
MSNQNQINSKEKLKLSQYFIYIFIIITLFLITLRILLYFFDISEWIQKTKDIDFKILIEGMKNGLFNFYDDVAISDWPPYYLYFWYFIFLPIFLIPNNILIGLYIWDILRLILTLVVVKQSPKVFKNEKDLLIFYILGVVGYSIDAYYNNVNFLIVILLFYSYISLEKEKKWIAGILFTLATFKITALLFLPVLLIIRKIRWKDLIYFLIPFFIICIPYIIFPDYFFQMVNNWFYSDEEVQGILIFDSIMWKALQPSHLMFIGLLLITFLENITKEDRKNLYRNILVSIITVYYVYLTTIVFIIPVILG